MFKALGRYLRIFFFRITGQIDKATQLAAANPDVMNAQYSAVIAEKTGRINDFMAAVALFIHTNAQKEAELKRVSEEIVQMRNRVNGANNKAGARVKVLQAQGKTKEEILADSEVKTCQVFVRDSTSTLKEKEARVTSLEADIKKNLENIEDRKRQALGLKREIQNLRQEQGEAVADVIISKQEEQANKILAGIGEDETAKTLQSLREMRGRAKAQAQVSGFVAETDVARQAAEFDEYAHNAEADKDFLSAIGLDDSPAKTDATTEATKAPATTEDPLAS